MTSQNAKLIKVAAIGGIATVLMGYIAHSKIEQKVKSASFYLEAMKSIRSHPAAVHLLGEPIKVGTIAVGRNSKNFVDVEGNRAQFEVPLKGSKQKGTAYLSATKQDGDEQWTLSRVELEVRSAPDKRVIIKSSNNNST